MRKYNMIIIGISTGGPNALRKLVPALSCKIKLPIFIIQHMPKGFTKILADGLNELSELEIKEGENEVIKAGTVYVLPGGQDSKLVKVGNVLKLYPENKRIGFYNPSVDYFLESVNKISSINPLIAILTGMGRDGTEGILNLKENKRSFVLTQEEKSCVVYGMPKSIDKLGLSDVSGLTEKEIGNEINKRA
ncbi:CheB methylesterase domain-containing protein [Haliovirga abyssi]|uniref:protein-glutamate methylesterase n=1 Tax=Haliovirga abyssi TaxID=2996794 RepID=A0AAU9DU60_9FUSO|nr:CheB methylesterase domain-containing protein [Haliovirga abyssi]BDU50784.1 hypothetical protein HLVA_13530 [Haliovirga abyssi]